MTYKLLIKKQSQICNNIIHILRILNVDIVKVYANIYFENYNTILKPYFISIRITKIMLSMDFHT